MLDVAPVLELRQPRGKTENGPRCQDDFSPAISYGSAGLIFLGADERGDLVRDGIAVTPSDVISFPYGVV